MTNANKAWRTVMSVGAGLPIALIYGLFIRWLFGQEGAAGWLTTLSLGFLLFLPLVIGALTVGLAPGAWREQRAFVLFMPWLAVVIIVAVIGLLQWEAVICIVMALPLFLPLASLGGWLFRLKHDDDPDRSPPAELLAIALLALLPLIVAPLESRLPQPDSYHVVANSIVIDAPVAVVWANIASVPLITPDEQGFSFFHLLGLPKPLEATLTYPGVGGVRHATFEQHLTFVETVTEWDEPRRLSFSILADRDPELPPHLKQIGGRYLDILDGTYEIEPLTDGAVRLHLSSRHRLSTRFNVYGSLWTNAIMSDLQSYILRIIKARAEAGA
ncbi:MAG: hypothetical protein H6642_05210 [Caldilineaceae bacterium]|nr:hypothetical protein [Caldilineaceae bacterium]